MAVRSSSWISREKGDSATAGKSADLVRPPPVAAGEAPEVEGGIGLPCWPLAAWASLSWSWYDMVYDRVGEWWGAREGGERRSPVGEMNPSAQSNATAA